MIDISFPLNGRYANTFPIAVYKNRFGFAVNIEDYETEQQRQKKKAI